jgi:3-oxoacyl-[acyl-carrier-protein] synthase II
MENNETRRIVVTGVGPVTSIGIGRDAFFDGLIKGKNGVGKLTRFDATDYPVQIAAEINDFDPFQYGMDKKQKRLLDLYAQYCMAGTFLALEDAGVKPGENVDSDRIMIRIGTGVGGIGTILEQYEKLLINGPGKRLHPHAVPMIMSNAGSANPDIAYGITGQNNVVGAACESGADAETDIYDKILLGRCELAITGGAEAGINPFTVKGFSGAGFGEGALSKTGSRPFDADRDGFVMGEGAGILILEELQHALDRNAPNIYAEFIGYGHASDAHSIVAPHPEAAGLIKAIENAFNDFGVDKGRVSYINAHGTSTPLNDKAETKAFKAVFGERAYDIPISSTKSMIGHGFGAAAGIETIATVLSIKYGVIHPTINYKTKDPECDLDYTPNEMRECDIDVALKTSSGFGGHNAALLFAKYT